MHITVIHNSSEENECCWPQQPCNWLLLKTGRTKVGEYLAIIATARVNHRNETARRRWLRGFSWEHGDNTQCGECIAVFHAVCFTDSEIQRILHYRKLHYRVILKSHNTLTNPRTSIFKKSNANRNICLSFPAVHHLEMSLTPKCCWVNTYFLNLY